MLSYWEKQSLLQYDYIVIGSGIVGLSTAISLKEDEPTSSVLVLEREVLPTGASTKNAGFACIGSLTEILADLQQMPEQEVINLVAMRRKGLHLLRQRLGDKNIDYHEHGSFELIGTAQEWALQQLNTVNKLLEPVLGGNAFTPASGRLPGFGFRPDQIKALVQNNFEGELHTGKMMRQLINKAIVTGVEIKTGCNVTRIEELQNCVNVVVPNQVLGEEVVFSCRKLAVCTNAFTRSLVPEEEVQPGRGQVLMTAPVKGLPFKGIFHMEEGYYYFRELDGCVLLGGGRQLDFKGETSTEFRFNDRIQHELETLLHTVILPGRTVTIDSRWTGIMAFGNNKHPVIRRYSENICLGVRMGGMGVAIGSMVGAQLATMMIYPQGL